MFNPSQHDVRRFFCEAWRKERAGAPLAPIEALAAQWIAELLPLTHFLRLVRGIMVRGAGLAELWPSLAALGVFIAVLLVMAVRDRSYGLLAGAGLGVLALAVAAPFMVESARSLPFYAKPKWWLFAGLLALLLSFVLLGNSLIWSGLPLADGRVLRFCCGRQSQRPRNGEQRDEYVYPAHFGPSNAIPCCRDADEPCGVPGVASSGSCAPGPSIPAVCD